MVATKGRSNSLQSELQFTMSLRLYFPSSVVVLIHVDSEPSLLLQADQEQCAGKQFWPQVPKRKMSWPPEGDLPLRGKTHATWGSVGLLNLCARIDGVEVRGPRWGEKCNRATPAWQEHSTLSCFRPLFPRLGQPCPGLANVYF